MRETSPGTTPPHAAGRRVWCADFNDSGVSNHNRGVERHVSRYGAYWKSYDFAGSVGTQNIFTHPLSFTHDGGEIIFNLPNGLQASYLVDTGGNRLDAAPMTYWKRFNGGHRVRCRRQDKSEKENSKPPLPPFAEYFYRIWYAWH